MAAHFPASTPIPAQKPPPEPLPSDHQQHRALRELVPADLPAVVRLCEAALDLPADAAEAAAIVERLRSVPPGRHTVALVVTADADVGDGSGGDVEPARPGCLSGVVFGSLNHQDPTIGHLDLVAVHPRLRRRGIGRTLLVAVETALAAAGAREVVIAGNMPYGWPGIDVRYTPALCAALALGYQQDGTAWNMTVDLSTPDSPGLRQTASAERRLAADGVTVRRATGADLPALAKLIEPNFSKGWLWEVEQSIDRAGAGCHLAVREATPASQASGECAKGTGNGEVLGFAAYGALRPSWFGPMGTAPAAAGAGIGSVLLRRCLADLRAAGHTRVQIGWVGPVPFYSRTAGAYVERVFSLFRKQL